MEAEQTEKEGDDDDDEDEEFNICGDDGVEIDVMQLILARIIFPEMIDYREKKIATRSISNLYGTSDDLSVHPTFTGSAAQASVPDTPAMSMTSSSSSSLPETLAATPPITLPRMLLCLDGDYPQIEAICGALRNEILQNQLESWKFAGGCSMIQQPNDLMKCHREFRRRLNNDDFYAPLSVEPGYMPRIDEFLSLTSRMQAASHATYRYFFARIEAIESQTFTMKSIQWGWEIAGIYPFSIQTMLCKCPSYRLKNTEEQKMIEEQTKLLGNSQRLKGLIRDEYILDFLGELGSTPITNMDGRVLIQQRALWLMSEDVYNFRAAREAEKHQALLEREEKAKQRDEARMQKARNDELLAQARERTTRDGNAWPPQVGKFCCNSICIKQCTSSSTWRCCSFCNDEMYVCGLQRCLKYLNSHQDVCAIRKNA